MITLPKPTDHFDCRADYDTLETIIDPDEENLYENVEMKCPVEVTQVPVTDEEDEDEEQEEEEEEEEEEEDEPLNNPNLYPQLKYEEDRL